MQGVILVEKFSIKIFQIIFCCVMLFNFELFAKENLNKVASLNTQQIVESELTAKELGKQWDGNSVHRSIALYLNVFNYWKDIDEFEKASDCLREISNFYIMLGKNDEAIVKLNQALQLDNKSNNPIKKIKTFSLLAIATLRLGKIDEARIFSKKALKISKTTNDSDALATALFAQAQVNYDNSEFNQATENYEKALSWWKKNENLSGQAKTLLELSYSNMTNDELLVGLEKAQESFKISNEIGDLQNKVLAQNAIAVLKSKLGKKQEALIIFLQSEKQFPDEVNALEKGDMFNHLGGIYFDFNELKLALKYRLKALEIFQKEKNPFAQLATISKLGIITFKLGDERKGLNYFDSGFKLAKQVKSDYYYSVFAQDLGNLYFEKNKQKALEYYKLAQPNFEKLKIRTHIAIIQGKIGSIYQSQGKNEFARKYFTSALKLNRETKNQFAESQNLYNLSNLDLIENNVETALDLAKQSIDITELLSSDVLNAKLKSTYFSSVYDRYELYINLLIKMHKQFPDKGFDVQALQASEKSRARSMLETLQLSEANFTKDADPELVEREKEISNLLNAKADKLTELLSRNADKAETDKLDDEINSLQNELEDIKGILKVNSPLYSAIKNPAPFDVGDFQANVLDDKTLLLEFSFGADESYVWLIGKNEVNHFTLPKREILDSRIQKLLDLLKSREISEGEEPENYQKRLLDAEAEYKTEARLLSDQLFGQFAERLDSKRLIIVPDGKLSYFPVSALPLPNTDDNQPILLTNEVVYESSAATLQILGKTPHPEKAAAKELLVFADPIFSLRDTRMAGNKNPTAENDAAALFGSSLRSFEITDANGQFPRLFATQKEAESIAGIVGASRTIIASGFSANRERFLAKDVADYKIIHFATHGLMDDTRPELSGIVLSLFDENGESQKGFIRLQDIYSQNLSADLIVLSACQSGVGKEIKGEGLMSLTGGFIQSGAKSVLLSLWKVDDYATAELMKNFYQELSTKNITPAEALRNAQIEMRKNPQFQSPFYWAAFTVNGEFRQPMSVGSNQFSYLWIVLAAFLASSIFLIFRFVKSR